MFVASMLYLLELEREQTDEKPVDVNLYLK